MATPLRTHTHEWNTQTHSGKRRRILTALITLLALVLPSSVAFGQAPPGPTTLYKSTLEVLNPPAQFDLIQLGLEFKPGARTPHHSHGGQALITMLDGAMTRHTQDAETTYKAGESWVEAPGEVHAAGNTTATTAHVQVSFILPKGAVLTTVQPGGTDPAPPGPTTLYKSTLEVLNPPAQFDLIQLGLEFKPGAWTPHHSHGGQALISVLDGAMTRRTQDAETTYKAGESWVETPGEVHAAGNTTATTAHVQVSFILPKGAVLTTVQQAAPSAPAALPKTGGSVDRALYLWVALLAVGGLIAGGWVIRRKRGRAA